MLLDQRCEITRQLSNEAYNRLRWAKTKRREDLSAAQSSTQAVLR